MTSRGPVSPGFARRNPAYTLVEVMFAVLIGTLVLIGVTNILLTVTRSTYKNQILSESTIDTRYVQEHMTRSLAAAVSQEKPLIRPTFADTSGGRSGKMTYRTPIGPYGTTVGPLSLLDNRGTADTGDDIYGVLRTSTQVTLAVTADIAPQVGDYLVLDSPDIGDGIRIVGISDARAPGAAGNITFTLAGSIASRMDESDIDANQHLPKDGVATIYRESSYETTTPYDDPATDANEALTVELRWYPNTATADPSNPGTYTVLSDNLDASERRIFTQITNDDGETAVGWQFTYRPKDEDLRNVPTNEAFLSTNFASGLIFPKSGDPLSTGAHIGTDSTSISTTTSSTSSTSSTTTSSTSSTTTSSTSSTTSSTTSKSTTKSTTSTSKSTTTSTTSKPTTSTTSTSTTSTTKPSTTSTTSKSTTKSTTTSTTSKSTTSKSTTSTTSKSTTSKSTTSTTSTSTSSTSKATTSKSTSTTTTSKATSSMSTSSATTSKSTSTTSTSSTTSASTSKSTTTATTTKASTSSSSKSTTTSIPFDG